MFGFLFRRWISPFNNYLPLKTSKDELDGLREKAVGASTSRLAREDDLAHRVEYFVREEASYKRRIEIENELDKLKLRRRKEKASIDFVENASAYLLLEKRKKLEAKQKNKRKPSHNTEKKKTQKKGKKKPSPFSP